MFTPPAKAVLESVKTPLGVFGFAMYLRGYSGVYLAIVLVFLSGIQKQFRPESVLAIPLVLAVVAGALADLVIGCRIVTRQIGFKYFWRRYFGINLAIAAGLLLLTKNDLGVKLVFVIIFMFFAITLASSSGDRSPTPLNLRDWLPTTAPKPPYALSPNLRNVYIFTVIDVFVGFLIGLAMTLAMLK